MSNTDGDNGIARRKVLAAAAGVGGLGIAGGIGTASLLGDSGMFEENLLQSGSLELDIAWNCIEDQVARLDSDGENLTATIESGDKAGSALLKIGLPGENNNPAHVWFQPTCPPKERGEVSGLLGSLYLEIYSAEKNAGSCAVNEGPELAEGYLGELAGQCGTKIDGCVEPGDTPEYLLVEWEYRADTADFETTNFEFRFFAAQCRNNDDPENPLRPRSCGKDISWVAFCSTESLTRSDVSFSVSGDTLYLDSSSVDLASVVLKYGTEIRVFDLAGRDDLPETYTTYAGGTTYEQDGNSYPGSGGRTNSEPCTEGNGLKYEINQETSTPRGCE